jgi:hypothetical protein
MLGDLFADDQSPLAQHRPFGYVRAPALLLSEIARQPAERLWISRIGTGS